MENTKLSFICQLSFSFFEVFFTIKMSFLYAINILLYLPCFILLDIGSCNISTQ